MSDKWMNIGHEDDPLKPYIQPSPDFTDEKRLGKEKQCMRCTKTLSLNETTKTLIVSSQTHFQLVDVFHSCFFRYYDSNELHEGRNTNVFAEQSLR